MNDEDEISGTQNTEKKLVNERALRYIRRVTFYNKTHCSLCATTGQIPKITFKREITFTENLKFWVQKKFEFFILLKYE